MLALVDLNRSAVGVFHNRPAAPRALLVRLKNPSAERGNGRDGLVERGYVETGKSAAGMAPFGNTPEVAVRCLEDCEVDRAKIACGMDQTVAVVLILEGDPEPAIEGNGLHGISREKHDRRQIDIASHLHLRQLEGDFI